LEVPAAAPAPAAPPKQQRANGSGAARSSAHEAADELRSWWRRAAARHVRAVRTVVAALKRWLWQLIDFVLEVGPPSHLLPRSRAPARARLVACTSPRLARPAPVATLPAGPSSCAAPPPPGVRALVQVGRPRRRPGARHRLPRAPHRAATAAVRGHRLGLSPPRPAAGPAPAPPSPRRSACRRGSFLEAVGWALPPLLQPCRSPRHGPLLAVPLLWGCTCLRVQ
jgi:hypothetical protein